MLNCTFVQLKSEHLVAGFRGCGIAPVNKEEFLKQLPGKSKDIDNKDSIKILNESCLSLLKEHCGIGLPEKSKQKKRGKKVQPDKPVTLEDFRDEENDQELEPTLFSSTRKSSKKAPKKRSKKRKHISSDFSSESESDQEVWICVVCKEEWEADDPV